MLECPGGELRLVVGVNTAGYGLGIIKAFQRRARYSLSRGNQTVGQVSRRIWVKDSRAFFVNVAQFLADPDHYVMAVGSRRVDDSRYGRLGKEGLRTLPSRRSPRRLATIDSRIR
jgi:hypothetical protein